MIIKPKKSLNYKFKDKNKSKTLIYILEIWNKSYNKKLELKSVKFQIKCYYITA
jgi:hypothetical protein